MLSCCFFGEAKCGKPVVISLQLATLSQIRTLANDTPGCQSWLLHLWRCTLTPVVNNHMESTVYVVAKTTLKAVIPPLSIRYCTCGAGALCSTLMASATACTVAEWERLGSRPSNCGSLRTRSNRQCASRCSSSIEYYRKEKNLSSTWEEQWLYLYQSGGTHGGNVEASTVVEALQQLLHEQYLRVEATNNHTGVLKGLIAGHL